MIGALIFEAFKSAALGYVVALVSTPKTKGKSAQEFDSQWAEMAEKQKRSEANKKAF